MHEWDMKLILELAIDYGNGNATKAEINYTLRKLGISEASFWGRYHAPLEPRPGLRLVLSADAFPPQVPQGPS